jgi:acetyl-CoA C-acetyltransferase
LYADDDGFGNLGEGNTMTRSVAILGAAALPVAKWQRPRDAELQVLEHEILADLVIEAAADAGVDKGEISSLAFAQPRPYTQQKYFATFIANYLQLPCTGSVLEVLGNGMTAALAFEAAANDIRRQVKSRTCARYQL